MVCKLYNNRQRAGISKLAPYLWSIRLYPTDEGRWPLRIIRELVKALYMHSNSKLQSETNTRHTEVNHVRTCPKAQIEAYDAKKRGRSALNS